MLFVFSCNKNQETKHQHINIDSVKKTQEVTQSKRDTEAENTYKKYIEARKQDSILLYIADSLKKVAKQIKQNRNISLERRLYRISKLYESIGPGNIWSQIDLEDVDVFDLLSNEIGLLLSDSNIVKYNIDSLFVSISKGFTVTHSNDNRLIAVSFVLTDGGTAFSPVNIIGWRDTSNIPKGYITSYSSKFEHLQGIAYYDKIFKLHNSLNKNLYLLFGESKGCGNNAIVIELTNKGINLRYRGFYTKNMDMEPVHGRTIVYNLGIDCLKEDFEKYNNYKFDKETQTIKFKKSARYYNDSDCDSLTIGTLTFNGKYFTERIIYKKIKSPNP